MGLDIVLNDPTATYNANDLYNTNITHNLNKMAEEAGIYEALWRPYQLKKKDFNSDEEEYEFERNTTTIAKELIPVIEKGYEKLRNNPEFYKKFNSPNGFGLYEDFVPFVKEYLEALKKYPEALVLVDR